MGHRYGIIGDPVEHSLSPVLHGAAFNVLGLAATYERVHVRPADLRHAVGGTLRSDFDGFNVTLPHKSAIIPLLDVVDPLASAVGAVNTVTRHDGRLTGSNTDVLGVRRSLEPFADGFRGCPVVIIGAGGTARSATAALAEDMAPSHLTYLVRDPSRADGVASLARRLVRCPVAVSSLDEQTVPSLISGAALVIQTTPVGMVPHVDLSPLPPSVTFRPGQTVFDVIYRPLETTLLALARRSGARVIDGLELFLQQGASAFERWTGRPFPLDAVRPLIQTALRA